MPLFLEKAVWPHFAYTLPIFVSKASYGHCPAQAWLALTKKISSNVLVVKLNEMISFLTASVKN